LPVGPRINDHAGLVDGTAEKELSIFLPVPDQAGGIHAIDDGIGPGAEKGRAILR
jgi:hypothetical protein